jgi:hypothetical protein
MKLLQHYRYNVAPWVRTPSAALTVPIRNDPAQSKSYTDRLASSISAI